MKRKLLTIFLGIALFIPISIVNASDITIDQIITELSNRLPSDEIQVQKEETNKIKVTITTDLSELYKTWPEGYVDDSDMKFSSYIEYEYNNSILSYKGNFGFSDSDIEYDALKSLTDELISTQNKEITKELTIAIYSLKGYQDNEIIENLKRINILNQDGTLNMGARTKSEGIETKITDGWVSEYNIYVDEICINNSSNTTDQNQNNQTNNNETTDNQEKNNKKHVLTTTDSNYIISFNDDNLNIQFEFNVQSIIKEIAEKQEQQDSVSAELDSINKFIKNITTEVKENGELIDIYNILVTHNEEPKTQGIFTFRIKLTDEMKKYDEFELINIDDQYKKQDIVKIKKDGEYLEGELPHLSTYALVGKTNTGTIKNPSTGIRMYGTIGLLTIITLAGSYIILKKKMSN